MERQLASKLFNCAEENGIVATIHAAFKMPVKVNLVFNGKDLEKEIDELEMSVRSNNCLKRAGIMTIGDLIKVANTDDLLKIRNLGRKSYIEIKTTLLAFSYDRMTLRKKIVFWIKFIEDNIPL